MTCYVWFCVPPTEESKLLKFHPLKGIFKETLPNSTLYALGKSVWPHIAKQNNNNKKSHPYTMLIHP